MLMRSASSGLMNLRYLCQSGKKSVQDCVLLFCAGYFGYAVVMDDSKPIETPEETVGDIPARRKMLMLGAAGVSVALTIRPAFAQTAASVMNCQIAVPDPGRASEYIDAAGKLVPAGTRGAFPGSPRPFTGEEVKLAFTGQTLPGTSYQQSQAYLQYIRRLQAGQSGFTCFASITMPR
jgi:hypothetical protein